MFVPQLRQRTVFPRADTGTASTLRQVSDGHMILMTSCCMAATSKIGLRGRGLDVLG